MNVAVQINRRLVDILPIPEDKIQDQQFVELQAKNSSIVQSQLDNDPVRKIVYVPGRTLSFMTR